MIRRPPRSTLFPTRRSSDLLHFSVFAASSSPSPSPACGKMGAGAGVAAPILRSEEHMSELQSLAYLVCRLLLEKKKFGNGSGKSPNGADAIRIYRSDSSSSS